MRPAIRGSTVRWWSWQKKEHEVVRVTIVGTPNEKEQLVVFILAVVM